MEEHDRDWHTVFGRYSRRAACDSAKDSRRRCGSASHRPMADGKQEAVQGNRYQTCSNGVQDHGLRCNWQPSPAKAVSPRCALLSLDHLNKSFHHTWASGGKAMERHADAVQALSVSVRSLPARHCLVLGISIRRCGGASVLIAPRD